MWNICDPIKPLAIDSRRWRLKRTHIIGEGRLDFFCVVKVNPGQAIETLDVKAESM